MKACKVRNCKNEIYYPKSSGYCCKHGAQLKKHGKILKRTIFDPNEFLKVGNICKIQLYNRQQDPIKVAIIDRDDYEKVKNYKWHICDRYVACCLYQGAKQLKLHHVILDRVGEYEKDGLLVDHRNRDPFDNRKSNLRIVNVIQNKMNSKIKIDNTSGFRGVCPSGLVKNKWRAYIKIKDKFISLGGFSDKKEAARIYNDAAIKYHGEFALLNVI